MTCIAGIQLCLHSHRVRAFPLTHENQGYAVVAKRRHSYLARLKLSAEGVYVTDKKA